jgi:magnesium-transporting ATPase (P-type)
MSGSKVLEGFGRMLVLAVGPNSQQGIIQQLVLTGQGGQGAQGAAAAAGHHGAAAPAAQLLPSMLREATPLTARLEEVAGAIGGVGLAAALGVLGVNGGLYTYELLAAGGHLWSSEALEVGGAGGGGGGRSPQTGGVFGGRCCGAQLGDASSTAG